MRIADAAYAVGLMYLDTGAPAGFKNVDAQPVGSGASLRKMIRNIDNYFAIG